MKLKVIIRQRYNLTPQFNTDNPMKLGTIFEIIELKASVSKKSMLTPVKTIFCRHKITSNAWVFVWEETFCTLHINTKNTAIIYLKRKKKQEKFLPHLCCSELLDTLIRCRIYCHNEDAQVQVVTRLCYAFDGRKALLWIPCEILRTHSRWDKFLPKQDLVNICDYPVKINGMQ